MQNRIDDGESSLFDPRPRFDKEPRGPEESIFGFMNRSAWSWVDTARNTLESWFQNFPRKKRADIRGRFRGEDIQHSGALLEMVTHEMLRTITDDVRAEPDVAGGRPDFSATYQDSTFIVECTVVQPRKRVVSVTRMEDSIRKAINSIDGGCFILIWNKISAGNVQPRTSRLIQSVTNWIQFLNWEQAYEDHIQYETHSRMEWDDRGWKSEFTAIPIKEKNKGNTVGVELGAFKRVQDDVKLKTVLETKAKKYKSIQHPYLLVAGSGTQSTHEGTIWNTMLGHENWYIPEDLNPDHFVRARAMDGFLGSPKRPRNRGVSAILYKSRFEGVWSLTWNERPWVLVHYPYPKNPLPTGLFPFAVEYIPSIGQKIEPTCTINDFLKLPEPWPGGEE